MSRAVRSGRYAASGVYLHPSVGFAAIHLPRKGEGITFYEPKSALPLCHFERSRPQGGAVEKSKLKNRESCIQYVKQYRQYSTRARQGKDPFGSPPFPLGGSLRVTGIEFS